MVKVLNSIKADQSKLSLDLNSAAGIALLKNQIATDLGSVAGVDINAFNALATDTETAIINVNNKVDSTMDLTSDTTKNTFSVRSALFDQLKAAGLAEKTSAGSGAANITLKDVANVNTAALNEPPTDISLSSATIAENANSLVVGTLTTTYTDQNSGAVFNYYLGEISGEDYGSISINQTNGQLSLTNQPDYETKTSYTFTLMSKDDGGKSISKSFTIEVSNARDTFDEAIVKTSVKYVKQDIYSDLNTLSNNLNSDTESTLDLLTAVLTDSYVDSLFTNYTSSHSWGSTAFNSSNTTFALTSNDFTITDSKGYSVKASFNNFNPTDLSQIQELVNIDFSSTSTWKIDGGFSSLKYAGPNGDILNFSFGDTETVVDVGSNYYSSGGVNKMVIHGKLFTDTVSDLLTLVQKVNAFNGVTTTRTFDSSNFYDLADYADGKFTFSGISVYRDGETKAAASTKFSGDNFLLMSLEDYTLTLTAEDIAQFQVPAEKLENFGNLTQQQINDILSDAYVPTNKDASITFSHLEYGDLIKIETDNVGYDIIAEKGNFPSWSELNTTYGINSAGEHFVHDDDYILMSKVNFGSLDASAVDTQAYFEGWNSQTLWLQQIYNDIV